MRRVAIILVALFGLGLIVPGPAPGEGLFAGPVAAQDPIGDAENTTQDAVDRASSKPEYDLISILASPMETYLDIDERGVGVFPVQVVDSSVEGTEQYSSAIDVVCVPTPVVDENVTVKGWAVSRTNTPTLYRNTEAMTAIQIIAGPFASPEFYRVHVVCEAGHPLYRTVGEFYLTAHVKPYVYMVITSVGIPEKMAPFERFTHQVAVTNNGNQPEVFYGSIDAPEGWTVSYPRNILVQPGETELVEITGHAPRDKIVYLSGSGTMFVKYSPATAPGKGQTAIVPLQVQGIYMHPALVPLVVLAVTILVSIIFLAVLARRAIEEQILGKPVPPWRIPVEREMLQKLQKEDPDQYYIVRYYLMVEEHESALLWFAAYKKATKKDRKRERKWYKVKKKQERKVAVVEKDHAKVGKKWDRKVRRVERKRDRKIRKLERRLRRKERKEQRGLDAKHKKRVKKIKKKHKKRVKKGFKKHEKLVAKETKKVDRQNRRLAKKGEELLPLPEIPPPEVEEPELPEKVPVEEMPLEESRYAKRADRIRERAETRLERLRLSREKDVNKDRVRADVKIEKLLAKIPPEPKTHLYDEAEYVPESEIVVEDDRPLIAKILHIPTLEEREQIRRRRSVYRATVKAAKAAKDPEKMAEAKRVYQEEVAAMKEARRAELATARAGSLEAARLKKVKGRRTKRRAVEDTAAAPSGKPPATPPGPVEPGPAEDGPKKTLGLKFPVKRGKGDAGDAPEPSKSAPKALGKAGGEDGSGERPGLRARFKRRPDQEAGSEEDKKETTESRQARTQGKE